MRLSHILKIRMNTRQNAKLVVYSRRLDPLLKTLRALRVKNNAVMPKLREQSPMKSAKSLPTNLMSPKSPATIARTVMSTLMNSFMVFLQILQLGHKIVLAHR